MAAVDPNPVADHDPFSLGDSDDEESKKKDLRVDGENLKQSASEAMAEDINSSRKIDVEPSDGSEGPETQNKGAEKWTTAKD